MQSDDRITPSEDGSQAASPKVNEPLRRESGDQSGILTLRSHCYSGSWQLNPFADEGFNSFRSLVNYVGFFFVFRKLAENVVSTSI